MQKERYQSQINQNFTVNSTTQMILSHKKKSKTRQHCIWANISAINFNKRIVVALHKWNFFMAHFVPFYKQMIAIFRSGEQPLKQQEALSLIQNKWAPTFWIAIYDTASSLLWREVQWYAIYFFFFLSMTYVATLVKYETSFISLKYVWQHNM